MSESDTLKLIQRLSTGDTRLWRNQVGAAWTAHKQNTIVQSTPAGVRVILNHARRVSFGIPGPGGSDLIGLRSVIIRPDMAGQTIAVFTAIETKSATGRSTLRQHNFVKLITDLGGLAGTARSVEDAERILMDIYI